MSAEVPSWQPLAESVAVVVLLAAGMTALFLSLPDPGVFDPIMLHRAGGLSVSALWTEPWRLLSATWLHADLSHLVGNVVMMLLMSILLTRALGWDRYVLLYLGSGLAGSVLSAALEQPDLNIGASGAVFGLTGATVAYAIRPRKVLHELEVHAIREALLPLVGVQLLLSFLPGVSWAAHLGGFAFGLGVGLSGLLDLGLPERSLGGSMPPMRWSYVVAGTVGVLSLGCCAGEVVPLGMMALYVVVLAVAGRSGPDWRPQLKPPVMLAALGALSLNGAAVGMALWVGQPWDLDQPLPLLAGEVPESVEEVLPGGLGAVTLPAQLVDARTEEGVAVRYGSQERHPFALRIEVQPRRSPGEVVRELVEAPAFHEGPVAPGPRWLTTARWSRACPWVGWETAHGSGIVVFTDEAVVDLQLERWAQEVDRPWARAEELLVRQLYRLEDCGPSGWTEGELGLAVAEGGLEAEGLRMIGHQLEASPEDHELRLAWADLSLGTGTCQGALIEFDRLTDEVPDEARGWTGLARATLSCGRSRDNVESAAEAAEKALVLDPTSLRAWETRGEALVALGKREEAKAAMLRAAELAPEGPERERLRDRAEKAGRGFRVRDRIGG